MRGSGRAWRGPVLLALFAVLVSFLGLGSLPLLDPDEARYSAASRDMILRGDYVIPWFNGAMRLKKPPLFYWLQAGSFQVFGEREFAARLPSALGCLLLVALTVVFAWRAAPGGPGPGSEAVRRRTALRAGAILVTMPLVFACAHLAIIDMTLAVCIAATLFLYFEVDRGAIAGRTGSILIGVVQGLAWLAKGPVGTLAPLSAIVLYHLVRREPRRLLRARGPLLAAGVAAAIGLPWLLLAFQRVGMDTFLQVAFRETMERADSGLEHPQPFFFYLVTLPLVSFPWSVFFVPAFLTGGWSLLGAWRARRAAVEDERPEQGDAAFDRFLWCWVAGMVIFFSCIAGKLATYMLPVLPAVALLTARGWERWSTSVDPGAGDGWWARAARREWLAAVALLPVLVGLTFLVAWWDREHARAFWNHSTPFVALAIFLVAGVLLLSGGRRRGLVAPVVAAATAGFYAAVLATGAVELAEIKSLRSLTRELRLAERPDVQLAVYRDFHPSLAFYARRPFTQADDKPQLQEFLSRPGPAIVIMDDDRWNSLSPRWQVFLRQVGEQDRQRAFEKTEAATPEALAAVR
jgi:4-amino-4-deoxy-L-arabinose transferase-like glycosyltransferase